MDNTQGALKKADWPQIGDIVPNHDGGRQDTTDALVGRSMALIGEGTRIGLKFGDGGALAWETEAAISHETAEAFHVRDQIYFVDFVVAEDRSRSVSLILDLDKSRYLMAVVTAPIPNAPAGLLERLAAHGSQSAVAITYNQGSIDGGQGEPFARTSALVGKAFRFKYSDTHLYDHYYISDRYYAWFCQRGPDAGLGDFEEAEYFLIGPDLYLLCWREKLIPCVGITVEDHRSMRSIGKIFGADAYTGKTANTTAGADITLIATIPPVDHR